MTPAVGQPRSAEGRALESLSAMPDVLTAMTRFVRALAGAGIPGSPDRSAAFVAAAHCLDVTDRDALHAAGLATLTSSVAHRPTYDRVFEIVFGAARRTTDRDELSIADAVAALPDDDWPPGSGDADATDTDEGGPVVRMVASRQEVLRQQDIATLDAAQRAELHRMIDQLRFSAPHRRSRRPESCRRGLVDPRRTLRAHLTAAGEPALPRYRRASTRDRRVVLLVDVSGSMRAYADTLLRFCHVWSRTAPGVIEVFSLGTRLTRLTAALSHRDADTAYRLATTSIHDYAGGTRLGEMLAEFLTRWGRRGTARGAIVVVFSDGWEQGPPDPLADQVQRLARLARLLIWVNPHQGKPSYQPIQRGIAAVLPHLDAFLAGHSLATLQRLLAEVADA